MYRILSEARLLRVVVVTLRWNDVEPFAFGRSAEDKCDSVCSTEWDVLMQSGFLSSDWEIE